MNNEQFRRLLQANEENKAGSGGNNKPNESQDGAGGGAGGGVGAGGATPGMALGSRMRSNIPMTPRSVTGVNFARQLADYRREGQQQDRPTKRFKSSSAPKGAKLPTGYQDRAQQRQVQRPENSGDGGGGPGADIEKRVAALEELVKEGQIDRGTFEKLRTELGVGGDVKSTHMVKGLDWGLLKRVKAGEDVNKVEDPEQPAVEEEEEKEKEQEENAPEEEVDLDAEFDRVTEEKGRETVAPVAPREKKEKKGTMAPPPVPTQQKKSRNDILQELKASRAAAAAAAAAAPPPPPESVLGSKFKKLSDSKPEKKRWVEKDENGRRREVLLVTDAQGKTKRKTRWLDKPGDANGLLVPDKDAKPLGMEVPADVASKAAAAAPAEDEDEDIFDGVGADYNPLADIGEDDDSSSESDEGEVERAKNTPTEPSASAQPTAPTAPTAPTQRRNYFATSTDETDADEDRNRTNPLTRDPTLLAALKRAASLRQTSPSRETGGEGGGGGESRGRKFLEEMRRREAQDVMDMDMGFGGSRNEDGEEDEPVMFEGEGQHGGQKRKRGPKKRKGDKESASDVLRVMDERK